VTEPSLIERLAALPTLASVPRAQLEWLVSHGEVRQYQRGQSVSIKGNPIHDLFIILAGRISIRLDHGGIARVVKEWKRGDVSGYLPYSRLSAAPGTVLAEEPFEALVIPNAAIREMTRECYEFTALCVHEMLDRARQFKSEDLLVQKLASLGVLSAGIAHELNNPSSALARSAKELEQAHADVVDSARALGAACLSEEKMSAIDLLHSSEDTSAADLRSPLERADREDAIADWLDRHGIDPGLAEPFANTSMTLAQLDGAAGILSGGSLALGLRYVAANLTARRLTTEIVKAAERIHELAARVKKQTHMDRTPVVDAIPLEESLADTLALIGSKARSKGVILELKVEPNLPRLQGVLGELNQVWLNLIDNAIDAAPQGGHVTVAAAGERDAVVVRVIDDGQGIAATDRDRIFDQFYTTKPVGKGTGLGLPTAQAIVLGHRGTIQVESRPGRTEFRVSLPVGGGQT
jgi:signal transduction histidine kinase